MRPGRVGRFALVTSWNGQQLHSARLEWAADEQTAIDATPLALDMDALHDMSGIAKTEVRNLSAQFYAALAQFCEGESLDIVRNVDGTNGWEAWRLLSREYDPTGSGRRRTVLSSILRPRSCDDKDLRSAIPRRETKVRVYNRKQGMTGGAILDDDIMTSVLVDLTKGKLREHLELNLARLTSYTLVKTEIDTYLEKKTTDIVDNMDLSTMARP